MISALLYLQYHSTRNRLIARLKRLRQPKYLIGAIVGGIYFYFYFFRFLFRARSSGRAVAGIPAPTDPVFYQSIGALILLTVVLLVWLWPHKRAALAFTEAEVAFLFPAPITRRALIHFKLLRSQLGILFTVLFFTLISNRLASGGKALIHAAGWWVILSTLTLHMIGSSFARTMLLDRGITNWQRRLGVLALVLVAIGVVGTWAARSLPPLTGADFTNPEAMLDHARRVLVSGPLPYLLYPFRLVVRPYLAPDAFGFLNALWPALLLMAAHYWWVIRADVAFEEASLEVSQRLAERIAAARAGNWRTANKKLRAARAPFNLAPTGPQPVALLWKNLIAAGQAFSLRTWIMLAVVVLCLSIGMRGMAKDSGWAVVVGMFAASFSVWAVLFGPQMVRHDFRQDLPLTDVLKAYPMRGWQVALGEILAPAVILTGVQWLLLIVAAGCFSQAGHRAFPGLLVAVISLGAATVTPALNLISLLIPNAAVLLFPAWFQAGREGPQGIEAMGQRLVFALGQFLAFVITMIPAAVISAASFFLVKYAAGVHAAVLVASAIATLVLGVEAGLGVMAVGRLFDRFDLSSEPQS